MSLRKTVCALSLASGLALVAVFALGSQVWAGGILGLGAEDVPLPATVDQDTLSQAQSFDGEYVFVGGQKERDGVAAAIETTLDAVNPMVRGIGRKRLQESNVIPKRVTIDVEGDSVRVLFDGEGHRSSLDGSPIKAESPQGDKVKVSHRLHGSKLVEFIDGVGGDRHNHFKLASDGARLLLDVTISSPQLPVPVEYRLTFKRN